MVKCFFKRYGLTLSGVMTGALGGFLYWYYIGCVSGTCPITSSPVNSTLWGMLLGGLLFNMFQKRIRRKGNVRGRKSKVSLK